MVKVILSILIIIESSGNPLAYNPKTHAVGLCQITPIVLKEWNNYHPKEQYLLPALWDEKVNKKIAEWYVNTRIPQMLKFYGIKDCVRNRLWAYNAGIKRVIKGIMPKETKRYIEKYKRMGGKL